jgi:hypothetical protein
VKSFQTYAFDFIKLAEKAEDNLTPDERKALKDLSSDPSTIITKAEKGEAVVVQDTKAIGKKQPCYQLKMASQTD